MFAVQTRSPEQHALGPTSWSQYAADGARGFAAPGNDAAGLPPFEMPPCECPEWCPLDHDNE
jgi:hypothetical protein